MFFETFGAKKVPGCKGSSWELRQKMCQRN